MAVRALCLLAMAPSASALRVERPAIADKYGGWDFNAIKDATDEVMAEVARAMNSSLLGDYRVTPGEWPTPTKPDMHKNKLSFAWNVSQVETGTHLWFRMPGRPDCQPNDMTFGECKITSQDNTKLPELHIFTDNPLDKMAHFEISLKAQVGDQSIRGWANCKLCGHKCQLHMPMDTLLELEAPECPIPPRSFIMTLPVINMGLLPADVQIDLTADVQYHRGDPAKTKVGHFRVKMWKK